MASLVLVLVSCPPWVALQVYEENLICLEQIYNVIVHWENYVIVQM